MFDGDGRRLRGYRRYDGKSACMLVLFGSFCRYATRSETGLSNITEEDLDLHARLEDRNVITIFPGGISTASLHLCTVHVRHGTLLYTRNKNLDTELIDTTRTRCQRCREGCHPIEEEWHVSIGGGTGQS